MRDRVVPWLWEATRGGALPVVSDATSCTEGLQLLLAGAEAEYGRRPRVVDVTQFVVDELMPFLTVPAPMSRLALHPTCSSTRLGLDAALLMVAHAVADEVVVPEGWGCCGFAGDRGLLHPELTESATRVEAESLSAQDFGAYASCNRTCEIGMSRATGRPYRHLIELLAEAAVAVGT
jgi:D-lactate dehydrogenase